MLYAIGVGAGLDELAFSTENSHDTPQRVLPTYGVIACRRVDVLAKAGDINWGKLVHGSQTVRNQATWAPCCAPPTPPG